MTLWDVTYAPSWTADGQINVLQVEGDTISMARTAALPIVGSRSTIIKIDPATPVMPVTNPSDRKVQGT